MNEQGRPSPVAPVMIQQDNNRVPEDNRVESPTTIADTTKTTTPDKTTTSATAVPAEISIGTNQSNPTKATRKKAGQSQRWFPIPEYYKNLPSSRTPLDDIYRLIGTLMMFNKSYPEGHRMMGTYIRNADVIDIVALENVNGEVSSSSYSPESFYIFGVTAFGFLSLHNPLPVTALM